mmetsp:Transcript_8481/g.21846  ORF Transcript_8481/g.21846 Transcript_8481/m.21846 type:complete len:203 (+) Transcript_8481:1842-2450(+)
MTRLPRARMPPQEANLCKTATRTGTLPMWTSASPHRRPKRARLRNSPRTPGRVPSTAPRRRRLWNKESTIGPAIRTAPPSGRRAVAANAGRPPHRGPALRTGRARVARELGCLPPSPPGHRTPAGSAIPLQLFCHRAPAEARRFFAPIPRVMCTVPARTIYRSLRRKRRSYGPDCRPSRGGPRGTSSPHPMPTHCSRHRSQW